MRTGKRYMAAVVCLLLVASFMAGCATQTPKTEPPPAPVSTTAPSTAPEAEAIFKAGVYEGTGQGRNGPVTIAVTVSDAVIEKAEIVAHTETEGIGDNAFNLMLPQFVEHQTLAVDTVTGATLTSVAVLGAMEDALTKAGADVAMLKSRTIEAVAGEDMELNADIVVVGGGGAGIAASIAAAENGACVILIEKADILGGNTLISGGLWNAVDKEIQGKSETVGGQVDTLKAYLEKDPADYAEFGETLKALQEEIRTYLAGDTGFMFDTVNLHMIQLYEGGLRQDLDGKWHYSNFELAKTFCENSLGTLLWTRDNWGMEWKDTVSTVYGGLWKRGHENNYPKGSGYFQVGQEYAGKLGVEIMLATAGKSLITENGRVTGVEAEKSDGTKVTLHAAKGVVIATGGYGGSVELIREYNNYWPALPDELTTNNVSTNTGDGIFMCRDIGADLVGMEFVQLMALSHPVTNSNTGLNSNPENTLYVNQEGLRFVNEYAARDVIAAAAFAQTNGMFYTIDDKDTAAVRYTQQDLDGWLAQDYIATGETLEALAAEIGIDPATLVSTVQEYNGYVDAGEDPDFQKNVMAMKVENGPFYATPHKPNVHHTMGGLRITPDTKVLDTNGDAIPGLFAAGEVTGGIHAGNRLGGNAVADAFIFGKIAGENAARA